MNAPQALRDRENWVLRKGKQPVDINGSSTGWNSSSFWMSYDEVVSALNFKPDEFSGIGYVVARDSKSGDNQVIGGDLDCCRDPITGWVSPWADKILKSLNSVANSEGLNMTECVMKDAMLGLGKCRDGDKI